MKAKFVFEHIDFERGLDPKTSMKIGHQWTPEELINIYKKTLLQLKDMGYNKKLFAQEIWKYIPDRFIAHVGWGNLHKIINDLNDEEFENMKKIILKYYNLSK
jgi:hypothetical protein